MKKLLLFMGTLIPYLSFGQDGTLDQTFATNGYALAEGSYTAKAVKIQSDGKIVTCGAKSNVDGTDFCVVRFNTNGSLDNTFGTNGISLIDFDGKTDEAFDLSIQNDGKIVVVGGASIANNNDFATVRLNTNGSLDNTFGTNGKVTTDIQNKSTDVAYKVAIQADGKIVIIGDGGSDMFSRNAVVRYTSSGSLDNTFDTDGKLVGLSFAPFTITTLTDMKVLNDGKLIISGSSSNQPAICKLNTDGTFDITFNTTGKLVIPETIFGGNLSFIGIQADGKLVISYGSGVTSEIKLFRIQANGSLDTDFGNAGKASVNIGANNEYTMGINVLSNGKIIVCGSTYANTSNTDFFVARLTSKGELDNTFGTNGFTITSISPTEGDRAEGMAMQADGKIIVAGNKCTGSCNYVVLRYNNTGASSSINSLNNFTNCQVYPNPATNQVNISLPNNTYQTQVTITNLTGKVLINKLFETNTNLNINTEILNKGVYVIFIENNGMVTQKKLVIE